MTLELMRKWPIIAHWFLLLLFSCSVASNSFVTRARLLCPWDFPSMNTGMDCHFLLLGDLPVPGIKSTSPALPSGFFTIEPPGKPLIDFRMPHFHLYFNISEIGVHFTFCVIRNLCYYLKVNSFFFFLLLVQKVNFFSYNQWWLGPWNMV